MIRFFGVMIFKKWFWGWMVESSHWCTNVLTFGFCLFVGVIFNHSFWVDEGMDALNMI